VCVESETPCRRLPKALAGGGACRRRSPAESACLPKALAGAAPAQPRGSGEPFPPRHGHTGSAQKNVRKMHSVSLAAKGVRWLLDDVP